jgi:hypothetical protein
MLYDDAREAQVAALEKLAAELEARSHEARLVAAEAAPLMGGFHTGGGKSCRG